MFLDALHAALLGETVTWTEPLTEETWVALVQLAQEQKVLPIIYEAVYASVAARGTDPQLLAPVKRTVIRSVMAQAMRTEAFFKLYDALCAEGLTPLVVKGVVCRELYPKPDHRMSADEDILLPQDQLRRCHHALLAAGLKAEGDEDQTATAYETSFYSPDLLQHIELHSSLFPPESHAYGDLAALFDGAFDQSVERPVAEHTLRTLSHTDHMLFLLCHAFKHFLHSGFGVRQVCDIAMYANAFGAEIDWTRVVGACRSIRADRFAAALFGIGKTYLTLEPDRARLPKDWAASDVDSMPLLEDLLCSGVYGGASMSRRHSSRITLSAVSAAKRGGREHAGALKALFPSAADLEKRYPYLQGRHWLLPVAWTQRIAHYRKEVSRGRNNSAADAVRIGRERTALLKEYGIL